MDEKKERLKRNKRKYVVTHREKVNEIARNWRRNNPEKVKKIRLKSNKKRKENGKDLEYSRNTRLSTFKDGERIILYRLKKKKYPKNGNCMLCKEELRLHYHHWDDKDLVSGGTVKGIWVCWKCHMIITLFDKYKNILKMYKKYLIYKKNYDRTK